MPHSFQCDTDHITMMGEDGVHTVVHFTKKLCDDKNCTHCFNSLAIWKTLWKS